MHTATHTHAHTPAYTNSHCNKVILWPAQVNKVQERECGRSRRKWLSIYWLIISRRRRDERGEGGQINTHQDTGTERWSEPERRSVISQQISQEERQRERWRTDRKIEQKTLCKVAAMRVE